MNAEEVRQRIGVPGWIPGYACLSAPGIGIVFDGYTGHDVNVHVAVEKGASFTRPILRAAFGVAFDQLKVDRVTALVSSRNSAALKLVDRLGFTLEGIKRKGFGEDDECVFGMLRSECRWLDESHH